MSLRLLRVNLKHSGHGLLCLWESDLWREYLIFTQQRVAVSDPAQSSGIRRVQSHRLLEILQSFPQPCGGSLIPEVTALDICPISIAVLG